MQICHLFCAKMLEQYELFGTLFAHISYAGLYWISTCYIVWKFTWLPLRTVTRNWGYCAFITWSVAIDSLVATRLEYLIWSTSQSIFLFLCLWTGWQGWIFVVSTGVATPRRLRILHSVDNNGVKNSGGRHGGEINLNHWQMKDSSYNILQFNSCGLISLRLAHFFRPMLVWQKRHTLPKTGEQMKRPRWESQSIFTPW